jgi:cobalt-zinc-cadmium efflux system membrane fusion protein
MNYLFKKHRLKWMAATSLLISLNACHSNDNIVTIRQPYTLSDSLRKTLEIDTVKVRNITYAIKFNGVVDFNTDKVSNIFPLVSGIVQDIHVMPGDFVKAGQVLGMVKSSEMANYSSSLSSSEAAVRLAKKQLEQQQDLYKSGMASKVDITAAEVNYEQAVAAKTAAQRVLMVNGNNTGGDYFIKSPIDGFLVQKNVTNGMAIRPDNSAPVFTVSNLKNVWVEANVYEENISKVHEGDEADISTISYPDKIFKGKVNRLMNLIDPNTKVMKMRVIIDNPDFMLKPQMFATVTINNTESDKAISVSSSALIFDHSQYYVVILKGEKDVELRQVEVISTNGKTAFIKNGVSAGERVIASKAILVYGSLNS